MFYEGYGKDDAMDIVIIATLSAQQFARAARD